MRFIDKYNCILCKYNKYNKDGDSCFNHQEKDEYGYPIGECKSLSNIYYGTIIKFFPFRQIHNFFAEMGMKKLEKHYRDIEKKYDNCLLEDDYFEFIWGVKFWDDLSGADACLHTMNDIDILYDKKRKVYMLGIETAYMFDSYADECQYLRNCLDAFTKYMDDNDLKKNEPFAFFMSSPCISMVAETIEELYTNFKIFVNGFCNLDTNVNDIENY